MSNTPSAHPSRATTMSVLAGALLAWAGLAGASSHVDAPLAVLDPAANTTDVYAFVDIPGRDLGLRDVNSVRGAFRIRNLTNRIYAAFSDSGLSRRATYL